MKPNIYVIDIESSPATALFYGSIYEPVIVRVVDTMQILSIAIQKYGEKKIEYYAQNTVGGYKYGKINDKRLLQVIAEKLKDADFICGHNLDQFDIPVIKERTIFHRLPAFPNIPTLDTKKLIKTTSRLPSNKLQHVTEFLGNGGKLEHGGTDLFIRCMEGDEKAWKLNEKYNKQDVAITMKDLENMLPYVRLTTAQQAFGDGIKCKNPICLSLDLKKSKLRKVVGGWKQQYQCKKCGSYVSANKKQTDSILSENMV